MKSQIINDIKLQPHIIITDEFNLIKLYNHITYNYIIDTEPPMELVQLNKCLIKQLNSYHTIYHRLKQTKHKQLIVNMVKLLYKQILSYLKLQYGITANKLKSYRYLFTIFFHNIS